MPESLGTKIGDWFLKPVYEDKNITYKARIGEDGQAMKGADGKTIYDVEDGIPRVLDWNGDGTVDRLEAGGAGLALAGAGLAAKALYKKHKEKKAQQQFSEDNKKKLSFPAKMGIAGAGLAGTVIAGDALDVPQKTVSAVNKVHDWIKSLDIDWTKIDVSKDGSPIDEIGVAVGLPLIGYSAGKIIQNSRSVKNPDKNFSEKSEKVKSALKGSALGAGLAGAGILGRNTAKSSGTIIPADVNIAESVAENFVNSNVPQGSLGNWMVHLPNYKLRRGDTIYDVTSNTYIKSGDSPYSSSIEKFRSSFKYEDPNLPGNQEAAKFLNNYDNAVDTTTGVVQDVIQNSKVNSSVDNTIEGVDALGSILASAAIGAGLGLAGKSIKNKISSRSIKSPDKNFSEKPSKYKVAKTGLKAGQIAALGGSAAATGLAIKEGMPVFKAIYENREALPYLKTAAPWLTAQESLKGLGVDELPKTMAKRLPTDTQLAQAMQIDLKNQGVERTTEALGSLAALQKDVNDAKSSVDVDAIQDLTNAGLGLALGSIALGLGHDALKKYKMKRLAKSTGKEFSDDDHVIINNRMSPYAGLNAISGVIGNAGKATALGTGGLIAYGVADKSGYIPESVKATVKDLGTKVSEVSKDVTNNGFHLGQDLKNWVKGVTNEGSLVNSGAVTGQINEVTGNPDAQSYLEEAGIAGAALLAGLAVKKAIKSHNKKKQDQMEKRHDVVLEGIRKNQIDSKKLLNEGVIRK